MIHRKVLYGYRIQDGALKIVPEEQQTVRRIFTLYNAGASYQRISDALNRDKIPYCAEAPLWNKHKVKRLLENPRYTGKDGYPEVVDRDTFQMAKNEIAEKNTGRKSSDDKSPLARLTPYFRCACGGKLARIGGKWQNGTMLYLKCGACESSITMETTETVDEIVRQFYTHECQKQTDYAPSADVIRLHNAINRGLEKPDSPEAVMALILQGAAARYECCPESQRCEDTDVPKEVDWCRFRQVVSYIQVMRDAVVTVRFKEDENLGKES